MKRLWNTLLGHSHPTPERTVTHYELRLFTVTDDGKRRGIHVQMQGTPPLPEVITLDGYSHDHFIALKDHWQTIKQQGLRHFTTPVTLYETIVKFGDTQQLVNRYELEIAITFTGKTTI